MKSTVSILNIEFLTHDVLKIQTTKPDNFNYLPGQAIDISLNKAAWEEERRAFTFTSLNHEDHLEFTIKTYPSHQGLTAQLLTLKPNDELFLYEVFGDITYKGKGLFIAGGAGITPFIAIFKQLEQEGKLEGNKLIFANKTKADIISKKLLQQYLGANCTHILSEEKTDEYANGYISKELLLAQQMPSEAYFYLCGPDSMMQAVEKILSDMGIANDKIIKEAF